MGILRTDRVSGLGGANAITGSTSFNGGATSGNHLLVSGVDTEFGTSGSFTMEFWMNPIGTQIFYSGTGNIGLTAITDPRTSDSSVHPLVWISGGHGSKTKDVLYYYAGGSDRIVGTTVLQKNRWYHVAVVRTGGTTTMYLDGSSEGSFSDSLDYAANDGFFIGQRYTSTQYNLNGNISNFRLIKGTALYTGTFTPPTTRLTKTSGTEILCCNSSSDVTNDETGKVINVGRSSTNDTGPVASRFTPNSPVGFSTTTDVGTQFGSTFDGVTTFDSQAYFVPPGGNTRERNRGRALITAGATVTPSTVNVTTIKYFDIASQGITNEFGNTTVARRGVGSVSSSTRACIGGGLVHPTVLNTIDFVTIANTANATDFGDMQQTAYLYASASNQTRGLFAGGYRPTNSAVVNTIDLITIATTGDASNFGDLTRTARSFGGAQSTTRAVFFGGTYPAIQDVIDFVTFSTTGDATDFGNLTDARDIIAGSSSNTRAVMAGGRDPSNTNIIDSITIASAGNATDFGDLLGANYYYAATSNNTRAVWAGDYGNGMMEFVTIASTGNAQDWGDMNGSYLSYNGAASDSHGGIS